MVGRIKVHDGIVSSFNKGSHGSKSVYERIASSGRKEEIQDREGKEYLRSIWQREEKFFNRSIIPLSVLKRAIPSKVRAYNPASRFCTCKYGDPTAREDLQIEAG